MSQSMTKDMFASRFGGYVKDPNWLSMNEEGVLYCILEPRKILNVEVFMDAISRDMSDVMQCPLDAVEFTEIYNPSTDEHLHIVFFNQQIGSEMTQ